MAVSSGRHPATCRRRSSRREKGPSPWAARRPAKFVSAPGTSFHDSNRSFAPVRLLITRPRADADAFAQTLRVRGHVAIVAPVMEVLPRDGPPLALDSVQAVLATSANGVRALAARSARRDVPLYAVGPQTAEAAEQA